MPKFRVKNLSISVGKAIDDNVVGPAYCTIGTTPYCGGLISYCPPLTNPTCNFITPRTCYFCTHAVTFDCPLLSRDPCGAISPYVGDDLTRVINVIEDVDELVQLRNQLEVAIKAVDERSGRLEEALRPRSAEEIEMVEQELEAALKEIRQMKKGK